MSPSFSRASVLLLVAGAAFFLASPPEAAAQQQAPISLAATANRLTITNVAPQARVVLAGMSIQSENGVRRMRRFADVLSDTDGDGRIEYVPEGRVPQRSLWAAVDLTSGSVATAGGPGLTEFLAPIPETALKKDVDGLITAFEAGTVWLDLVLVRPGEGAWRAHGYDGETTDEDNLVDGKVKLLFGSGLPVLTSFKDAPKHVKKDDVVILIDLRLLRLAVTSISK